MINQPKKRLKKKTFKTTSKMMLISLTYFNNQIAAHKKVQVRTFKKMVLIDFREFYEKDN